jgi:NADH:ubiquinone oxidoreductase subunit H
MRCINAFYCKCHRHPRATGINFFRRLLVLISLILSTITLSIMPLSASSFTNAGEFSLTLVLALIVLIGIFQSALGFSFQSSLTPLTALEQFFTRQSLMFAIAFACLSAPTSQHSPTLQALILRQSQVWTGNVLSWGILQNPIAFIVACVALALYTRQWFDNEVATLGALRKPVETKLNTTLLLTFKIARQLEYMSLYALLATVFLAGPCLTQYQVNPFEGFAFFFAKLFLLVMLVLGICHLLPRVRNEQAFRIGVLYLLPLVFVGVVASKWLLSLISDV